MSRLAAMQWRILVLTLLALAGVGALYWQQGNEERKLTVQHSLAGPLPEAPMGCPLVGEVARARAAELEALGEASWERVPFDFAESPLAWLRMKEAEACFRVAGDRVGSQRSGQRARSFELEISRLWMQSRLLLDVALKKDELDKVGRQVKIQKKLLAYAGDAAKPYHAWLARLARAAEEAAPTNKSRAKP